MKKLLSVPCVFISRDACKIEDEQNFLFNIYVHKIFYAANDSSNTFNVEFFFETEQTTQILSLFTSTINLILVAIL